ncbi:MAG: hypothetical protein ACK46Q_05305 [Hyphomonas sp.]
MIRARILAAALLFAAPPALALAEPASCLPENLATYDPASPDAPRLRCDIDRASEISRKAELMHGALPTARIEIVDTYSPSGSAYVYSVYEEHGWKFLEARSVPWSGGNGRLPACRMGTTLPGDVVSELTSLLGSIDTDAPEAYGPREESTLNPDGSRTVRLILDSHDVITRIDLPGGEKHFSRHARSEDDINRLNNLVIGVANLSSAWSCDAS